MQNQDMLDALLCLPVVWRAKTSPDGKWIAWSWGHKDDRVNVYAMRTDGAGKPIRLTDSEIDLYVVSFTPDGRSVVVEGCEDGNERIRLFTVTLDGSQELQPLIEENPPYFIRGRQLHPNGRFLVYSANYDFKADSLLTVSAVYRHNLKTGKRKMLAKPERSPINFVANIRGKLLIVQGGQDPNVTPENVRQVRKALKKARIRYQLLEFDNEGHEITKPENEAILYSSLARFFRESFGS